MDKFYSKSTIIFNNIHEHYCGVSIVYFDQVFVSLLGYPLMISKSMTSNMISKVKDKNLGLMSWKFSNPTTKAPERPLHKKWSFLLRISPLRVSRGFGHMYWRNPQWKTSFFVQWTPLVSLELTLNRFSILF